MKSNNELLGNHIIQCINMNKDMVTENLLGVNIDKNFMPSVANIVGTDLTTYKIIANNTFACNPMHVGRDKKLPVSLYKSKTPSIVSPAYYTFKIANETKLNPEYLMLLFRQDKFDRQCWFYTDSSVRGGLSWEDFCRIEIPVPPIEQQKKIVQTYNTLTKRIELKKQINEKLEAIAQAVYKHWFEDFEFPITEEYAKIINRPDLIGKPYKSSGGEMIYSEELDKYIPNGWETKYIGNLANVINGRSYSSSNLVKSDMALLTLKSFKRGGGYKYDGLKEYLGNYNSNQEVFIYDLVVARTDVTQEANVIGKPAIILDNNSYKKVIISLDVVKMDIYNPIYKYYIWQTMLSRSFDIHIRQFVSGTTVLHLDINGIMDYKLILPPVDILSLYDKFINSILKYSRISLQEEISMHNLDKLLYSIIFN